MRTFKNKETNETKFVYPTMLWGRFIAVVVLVPGLLFVNPILGFIVAVVILMYSFDDSREVRYLESNGFIEQLTNTVFDNPIANKQFEQNFKRKPKRVVEPSTYNDMLVKKYNSL
jgi:hypothetical protein